MLPFTEQQCFFVTILVFVIVGFQRGWRRELITLVFVLLAAILIRPGTNTSRGIVSFLTRIPSLISYLFTGTAGSSSTAGNSFTNFIGPWGTLIAFALIVALGYFIGNKAFPKPTTPGERFIGIVPAVISGAFILAYLTSGSFFPKNQQGQSFFSVVVQPPDPSNYMPIIFVIAVIAAVIGLIASRAKKPAAKK